MKITGKISIVAGQSTSAKPFNHTLVVEAIGTEAECRKALALMMKALEADQQ